MKKRTFLMLIMLLLIALVIFIFSFVIRDNNSNNYTENIYKENKSTVVNQGQSLLGYQEYVYLIDNSSNSLIRYSTTTDAINTIYRSEQKINDNMYIMNNNLIFSINDITYFMNLESMRVQKFTDGKVVYINEDFFMYIISDGLANKLYISSYDGSTFRRTNEIFYNLANGHNIKFLRESDGLIFFSSMNSDNSTSLFSVDLNNFEVTLIIRDSSYLSDTTYGEIIDAVKYKDEVYYIIANCFTNSYNEYTSNNDLYIRPIDGAFTELVRGDVVPDLVIKDNELIYGDLNPDTNTVEWKLLYDTEIVENGQNYLDSDISGYLKFEDLKLYLNGKEIKVLENIYKDFEINYAIYCKDKIYMLMENNSSHIWFNFNADGTGFNKIYEVK